LRVFFFEKAASYYFHSDAFLTKFSLFILVSLLSIIPTVEFLSWREEGRAGACGRRQEIAAGHRGDPRRAFRHRHHPALCGDHGARRLGLGFMLGYCLTSSFRGARWREPQMCNCTSGNLEPIISRFRVHRWRDAPE
jgi:Predicted membrane protein (DUF2214)